MTAGDIRPVERRLVKTAWFNIDNGSGTTIDDVLMVSSHPIVPVNAKIVYVDATAGTGAASATAKIGITVGGAEIVAATALEDGKTVGATTAMTLTTTYTDTNPIPANTMISVRHTGVATTVAGQYFVQFTYRMPSL